MCSLLVFFFNSCIGIAPASSPSLPCLVNKTLTTITINWTYPNVSDVDGYIVYVSNCTMKQNNGSQMTIGGLSPGTTYNITVRAYQDILGPPSDIFTDTTFDSQLKL